MNGAAHENRASLDFARVINHPTVFREIYLESIRSEPFLATSIEEVEMMSLGDSKDFLRRKFVLGAWHELNLVGFVYSVRSPELRRNHGAEIGGAYLRPAYRSAGNGSTMLREMMGALADNGVMFVMGWIAAGNTASFRAAESAGMARNGTIHGALRTQDGFMDGVLMVRYLQPCGQGVCPDGSRAR